MPRPDPIDEVWELLEAGEIDAAEAACARAELGESEPEEILLCRAAIATARDEVDRALELLDQAADALPDDPRPLLQAAELQLHGREDCAAAIALCERAIELADGEEEVADAVLLKAEAELTAEDDEATRATLRELDDIDLGDPTLWVRAGQLHFALEQDPAAERAFRAAIEVAPEDADALHGLGMIFELRGDREAMVSAWLDTRRIDLATPRPAWHLSADEFEAIAEAAMEELPGRVVALLENVPILIDDAPSEELVREGQDPRLLGLFSGVPLPEKGTGAQASLDSIHLYQRNLERGAAGPDDLADEIRVTVLHETAHFFGLDDAELEAIGLG
jgi:predicted Zn-dependent protease with MMP-like domain/Flp pilus assembly protein TadD